MAFVILYTVENPKDAALKFTGDLEHPILDPDYAGKPYGVAHSFSELLYSSVDPNTKAVGGVDHGGVSFQKELDMDTPFFKECSMRGHTIPQIELFFFKQIDGNPQEKLYFKMELKRVKVVESHVTMINKKLDPKTGGAAPHLEDIRLLFEEIQWVNEEPNRGTTYVIKPEKKK